MIMLFENVEESSSERISEIQEMKIEIWELKNESWLSRSGTRFLRDEY